MSPQLRQGHAAGRGPACVTAARLRFRKGDHAPFAVPDETAASGGRAPDGQLIASASRQHGLLTTTQLRRLGFGSSTIRDRLRQSRLFRVQRTVYAVGSPWLTREGGLLAAVLTYGEGATLTAGGALELWGTDVPGSETVEVAVPRQRRPRHGIAPVQASLAQSDLCAIDAIPLAAPARALLDYATHARDEQLEAALDGLRASRLLTARDLEELRERTRTHRGWGPLNRLLRERRDPGFSRSKAERRTFELVRTAGLPLPRRNARVGRWELDLLWPEHRVAVEFDSWDYHSGRDSFESDRAKSSELEALGIAVIRITWRQLTRRPEWVIAQLAPLLARARAPHIRA
jgi:very-short-patch-repair endonuclease